MPHKPESWFFLLLFLVLPVHGYAQSNLLKLSKDPFRQPDILRYRPANTAHSNTSLNEPTLPVPELKLTATLISVNEPMVIVNGKLLHIGEQIEGMTLSFIDEARAVFRYQGQTYTFTIEDR